MTLGLSAAADDRPRGRSGSAPCSRQPANPEPDLAKSKLTNPFEGAFVSLEVEVEEADEAEVDVGGRRAGALVV